MGISNNDFGDGVFNQVFATTSQCGVFLFEEDYHGYVLCNDGNLTLTNYHTLVLSEKDKYDNLARVLVASHLIVKTASAPVHAHTWRINTLWTSQIILIL